MLRNDQICSKKSTISRHFCSIVESIGLVFVPMCSHIIRRHAGVPPAAPRIHDNLNSDTRRDVLQLKRSIMAEPRFTRTAASADARFDASIDAGLRAYMIRVYNMMAGGLVITALAALGTVSLATTNDPSAATAVLGNGKMLTNIGSLLYGSPLRWVVMLAPLGLVFFMGFRIERIKASTASTIFWAFAALIGVSMSSIFLIYTSASIVQTFFITATAFGALSVYGYTTKRDLTAMGSFLFMGLIGIILAMVVNIFLQSSMMQFVISGLGVLIFAGLTAYDTQKIKSMYFESDNGETMSKKATMGALSLYLDFINMFQFLLFFLGNRE